MSTPMMAGLVDNSVMSLASTDPRVPGNPMVKWDAYVEKRGDILIVRNALPFLDDLASYAYEHPEVFSVCKVVNGVMEYEDKTHRTSTRLTLSKGNERLRAYEAMLRSVEGFFIRYYMADVNHHAVVEEGCGYDLLRYCEGQFFNEHVDLVRKHDVLVHRRLSVVAFCNSDFVGGELCFPRQGVEIKPETGMLVMFPAGFTHPHAAKPVRRGVKYSAVTWYF